MPAFATVNDFVCNDYSCRRIATQHHGSYRTEAREGRTMLDRLKAGLVCNIHAGGIKRQWNNRLRYNPFINETLTLLTDLGPEWDGAKAEYLAERKAAHEAAIARQNEQRKESQRLAKARLAEAWVERSTETEPDITSGTEYRSHQDHYREGFTVGSGGWRGTTVLAEQDYRNPATVRVTSAGSMSPMTARAVAKALLMAADLADIRDVTNGPKGES